MFKRLLIAIQSERELEHVVSTSAKVAAPAAEALVVHVRRVAPDQPDFGAEYDTGEQMLAAAVAALRDKGIAAESDLMSVDRDRPIGRAIADVAKGWRADVVVTGSRRLSDLSAALHGSVSHDVMRFAGCPSIVASKEVTEQPVRSILLAVDTSPASQAAEAIAQNLAERRDATITVVHVPHTSVVGPPVGTWFIDEGETDVAPAVVARLSQAGVRAELPPVTIGVPIVTAIADAADAVDADLVVVGTRGLGEINALFQGSVSHGVLHASARTLLAVPRQAVTAGAGT
jgi:nucleotide-binding universal stress UspA family protein